MGKIKVLQVIGSLEIGGAENVAMNYYRYIDQSKFEFHYLVFNSRKDGYYNEVYELGGKVITLDYKPKKIGKFYNDLFKLLKTENYNIVHSHTLFNSGIILHAARKAGIPKRIAHSHSTKNKMNSNLLLKVYEKAMRKLIIKNATKLIACSEQAGFFLYGESEFNEHGKVLLNGIELEKYKFNEKVRDQIRKKK